MHCRGVVGRDIALRCPSGRRSAPSLPNCGDEHEHEQEQEKGVMNYFLFFLATVLAGTINALAGGGGLITFSLLMLVVTPVPLTPQVRSLYSLLIPRLCGVPGISWKASSVADGYGCFDSKCDRRFDRSSVAQPDGQSQLYSVSTVVGVSRHCYHCPAADPGSTRRKWERASGHHGIVVACRNCGHFSGGIVWRLLRLRDWNPHDRRAKLYLAGRYPACGRA